MNTSNTIKTTVLLAALTGLMVLAGHWLGGTMGMVLALGLAVAMNFASYWFSDRIVLGMYRARPVSPSEAPRLHAIVDGLVARAQMPKPALYVLPQPAPNAFATGRSPEHAAVAVTAGLLDTMDDEEIQGVVAHELAHIQNRDILIGSIAATIAGAITMLATMARWGALLGGFGGRDDRDGGILGLLAMTLVAPIAALVIQLAVSRSREYAADATGARIVGSPHGLARALDKLGSTSKRIPMQSTPATSHMFIVKPLSGRGGFLGLRGLFSTHPPIEERIRRLLGR
jgi:heat shock protein HtpX